LEPNITLIEGFVKQDKEAIKFYEKLLKAKEDGLKKLKIEKFVATGKKFKVMKGGSSLTIYNSGIRQPVNLRKHNCDFKRYSYRHKRFLPTI